MQISNMHRVDFPSAPFVEATFDVVLEGGIVVRDCEITQGRSGYDAKLPGRGRRTLVELPTEMRGEFAEIALVVFRHLPEEADDAGLRRTLRAEVKEMVG